MPIPVDAISVVIRCDRLRPNDLSRFAGAATFRTDGELAALSFQSRGDAERFFNHLHELGLKRTQSVVIHSHLEPTPLPPWLTLEGTASGPMYRLVELDRGHHTESTVRFSEDLFRQRLQVAVVEHLHHWWASDALLHASLVQQAGKSTYKVDPSTLREIVKIYGVGRSVLSGRERGVSALLEKHLSAWPSGLQARAAFTKQLAQEAQTRGFTKGCLLSAFSKLLWFAHPAGWTMYDSFAVRGLGLGGSGASMFNAFYARLIDLEFDATMDACRSKIFESKFNYIWPERVLDKYLMRCGHTNTSDVIKDEKHPSIMRLWEVFHGRELGQSLHRLVDELAGILVNKPLFIEPLTASRLGSGRRPGSPVGG